VCKTSKTVNKTEVSKRWREITGNKIIGVIFDFEDVYFPPNASPASTSDLSKDLRGRLTTKQLGRIIEVLTVALEP
jgi:hypothetical protein